jgi:hypothetical protein
LGSNSKEMASSTVLILNRHRDHRTATKPKPKNGTVRF